jgi:hypothetical protein
MTYIKSPDGFKVGRDADKITTPKRGDVYIAWDSMREYRCFHDGKWESTYVHNFAYANFESHTTAFYSDTTYYTTPSGTFTWQVGNRVHVKWVPPAGMMAVRFLFGKTYNFSTGGDYCQAKLVINGIDVTDVYNATSSGTGTMTVNVVIPVQVNDIIELHYKHQNDTNGSRGQTRGLHLLSGPIDNSAFLAENFITITD